MIVQSPADDYEWATLPDPNMGDLHTVGGEGYQERAAVVHRRSLGFDRIGRLVWRMEMGPAAYQ